MSAIWGVLGRGASSDILHRMGASLSGRGGSGPGLWLADGIGLGHHLHRTSRNEATPLSRSVPGTGGHAQLAVVADAVIDNRRTLRSALEERGHRFLTGDDSELILHGYAEWGDEVVLQLQGAFAFALWDSAKRRLLLARDRFGEKPLCFRQTDVRGEGVRGEGVRGEGESGGRAFEFASQPRGLLALGDGRPEVDTSSLSLYLALDYLPAPLSMFPGIRKLGAGERLVVENGSFRTERYWSFSTTPKTTLSLEDARDELERRFDVALSRQLEAEERGGVGIFLSGGIDSTLVAISAAQKGYRPPLFSVGFTEEGYDETAAAQQVAYSLGFEHEVARLDAKTAWELHGEAAEVFEEPVADPAVLPTLLLSRLARQKVGTVLTGDGADELFGGYDTFVAAKVDSATRIFDEVKRPATALAARLWPERGGHFSTAFRLRQFGSGLSFPPPSRAIAWMLSRDSVALRELTGDAQSFAPIDDLLTTLPSSGDAVDDVSVALVRFYLEGNLLPKTDRSGAAVGLDIRSPFLDERLASFAGTLPSSWKLNLWTRKWMLRQTFAHRLGEVASRPKRGLGVPVGSWMGGALRNETEEILLDPALYRVLPLRQREVRRLLQAHVSGRMNLRKPLWNLVTLFRWAERWLAAPVIHRW